MSIPPRNNLLFVHHQQVCCVQVCVGSSATLIEWSFLVKVRFSCNYVIHFESFSRTLLCGVPVTQEMAALVESGYFRALQSFLAFGLPTLSTVATVRHLPDPAAQRHDGYAIGIGTSAYCPDGRV